MKRIQLEVTDRVAGERLDLALARLLPDQTRSYLQELIETGHVTCDGESRPARHRVALGARLEVALVERRLLREGGDTPLPDLRVVFEDEHLLVIDKPPAMSAHPGGSDLWGTVAQAAEAHCGHALPTLGGEERPGIVHRLDKDTSGLMVVAKTDAVFIDLQTQFREREVAKQYRAIVFGVPRFVSDWIERPIGRDPKHPERMRVLREGGREARTFYEVAAAFDGFAELLVKPVTGRTHQIRVHLSSVSHPIVRDAVYRSRNMQGRALPDAAPDPGRQCLHASRLAVRHPATGERLDVSAPLPDDMQRLLDWLRTERPKVR